MAVTALTVDYRDYLKLLSKVEAAPQRNIWLSYDAEADVLYINFQQPSVAADSELTGDDIIIRYGDSDEIVGYTILHASQR
ncbi:MAG: DUF2283 domain-containing protein [Chloroflexi bacterium]|nr:DUF2283 domain-containing protein [Chloroflexota bacterium]